MAITNDDKEEEFLREDYFLPNYLPIDADVEKVKEERSDAWKDVYSFIHSCNKAGRAWSDTDVVHLCEQHLLSKSKVEKAFRTIFEKHKDEHGIDNKLPIEKVKLFLKNRYDLNRNTITNILQNGTEEMNRNDIIVDLEHSGLKYGLERINAYLDSTYIEQRDPFEHYFENLEQWDQKDHIKALVKFIDTPDKRYFESMLKKHLMRCIQCALTPHFNRYVFVLSGANQRIGKSSLITWLNPFNLEYIAQGIPRNEKDAAISLTENFFINLDELAGMSKMDINKVKSLISQSVVRERRPHARQATTMVRRASFWATTNESEFLIDTVNTRWLVFEVEGIDWKGYTSTLNVHQIWAQAYYAYTHDVDFELTDEEADKQQRGNKEFEAAEIEKELIKQYFSSEGSTSFYAKPDIINKLQENSTVKLNAKFVAKQMRQLGFKETVRKINGHSIRGFMAQMIKGQAVKWVDPKQEKLF